MQSDQLNGSFLNKMSSRSNDQVQKSSPALQLNSTLLEGNNEQTPNVLISSTNNSKLSKLVPKNPKESRKSVKRELSTENVTLRKKKNKGFLQKLSGFIRKKKELIRESTLKYNAHFTRKRRSRLADEKLNLATVMASCGK